MECFPDTSAWELVAFAMTVQQEHSHSNTMFERMLKYTAYLNEPINVKNEIFYIKTQG